MRMMRKNLLSGLLFLFLVPHVAAQPADSLRNSVTVALQKLLLDPELKNVAFSFQALDLGSGKVIAEYQPAMSLVPASVMKLVTTAVAIDVLGSSFRFETVLQYTGHIDTAGVLHGDLIIRGGGDPTLGSRYYPENADFLSKWSEAVEKAGIREVRGRVIGDAAIYTEETVPGTWAWGDIGNGYGTAPGGLSIYDNIYTLTFRTGAKAGDSAQLVCVNPYVPGLEFYTNVVAGNTHSDNSYILGAPYSNTRIVKGMLPKGQEAFEVKGSIPDPAYLVAYELQHSLRERGILIAGEASTLRKLAAENYYPVPPRTDFYTHYSAALSTVVYWTNLRSVNLFAEHLINQLGVLRYKEGSAGSGSAAILDWWKSKKLEPAGFYGSDGSGLSRFNALSASHLVALLQYMQGSKHFSTFEKSLPIAGKTGTLSHLCKGTKAQGNLMAKSGTMTRVKSYAGYVTGASGQKIAFAMLSNNFNCTGREMEKKLEKLMVALAEYRP